YNGLGEPVMANRMLQNATAANAEFVRTAAAALSVDVTADMDFATTTDLASLLLDLSDDPRLLNNAIAKLLRGGQKQIVQEALQQANNQQPGNVAIAATYAQLLAADQQTADAIATLDHAAADVKSSSELYYLSAQY